MRCPVCGHGNPQNDHFRGACGRSPGGPRRGAEPSPLSADRPAGTTTPLPVTHPYLPAPLSPATELDQAGHSQPPLTAEPAPAAPSPAAWHELGLAQEPWPPVTAEPAPAEPLASAWQAPGPGWGEAGFEVCSSAWRCGQGSSSSSGWATRCG